MVYKSDPNAIYSHLRKRFGFLDWWPGETKFEIMVGAILTQQTTWTNVEKAISGLKAAKLLSLDKITKTERRSLEKIIRPSGYYRQKAQRLLSICKSIKREYGTLDRLFSLDKTELRDALLSYKGIGKETADSIILYAAEKPIFVIDAYTKRAMHRINPKIGEDISYGELQDYFEKRVKRDLVLYQDMHAQFVELGKNYCRTRPLCVGCPLNKICQYGSASIRRKH
ncbi:MAG: hypothetical protein KGH60_00055 [Candidatus Micrarchaeota archaeon]|nr:hypothetical protein [Candidatus Micrarchaeota archaeon]